MRTRCPYLSTIIRQQNVQSKILVLFLYYYVSYLSTLKLLDIRVHLTLFSVVGDALLMMVFTSIESPMLGSWPEQRR